MFTAVVLKIGALANFVSISVAEIALGLLIILALIRVYKTKDFSVFKKTFFLFMLLMIAAETISTFAGVDPGRSLKDYTGFWVLFYLPAMYVIATDINKSEYLMYVYAGAIFATLFGIGELIFIKKNLQIRADGFFSHALTYGNVMALISITALGELFFRRTENKRYFYMTVAALLFSVTAVIFSGSRGSILSFLIAALFMIVYRYRLRGLIAGVCIVVFLVGIVSVVPSVKNRFTGIVENMSKSTSSVGTRVVLWKASAKAIQKRPLFGYGKRNFKKEVSKYISVPTSSRAHAHNSYIQYTFLHGFFGLFAMLGFFASLFWEIGKRMKSDNFMKTAFFILLVFILEGLTENNFTDSEVTIAGFSLIGLILANGSKGYRTG